MSSQSVKAFRGDAAGHVILIQQHYGSWFRLRVRRGDQWLTSSPTNYDTLEAAKVRGRQQIANATGISLREIAPPWIEMTMDPWPLGLAGQIEQIVRRVGVPEQTSDRIGRTKGPLQLTGWQRPDDGWDVKAEVDLPNVAKRMLVFDSAENIFVPGTWEHGVEAWHSEVLTYPDVKKTW